MKKCAHTYLVRKYRVAPEDKRQAQFLIELRRQPHYALRQGDLWVSVTFQMPDGKIVTREIMAPGGVRVGLWNRLALVYDGKNLSLLSDAKPVASVAGPGPGARLLPSKGKSCLFISNFDHTVEGKPAPRATPWLATSYHGRIDELRITSAALSPDQLLRPAEKISTDFLPDPPKRSEYTSVVRRHLDLLLKHGSDVYGPVRAPLLACTLDPRTLKMVKMSPPILQGMPHGGEFSEGCNLDLMRNTLMGLRVLSQITGEARYAAAADKALRYWFKHCPFPSGVWPIGEHGLWNFYTDKPQPHQSHEPMSHLDWPLYYKTAPDVVAKEIDLMHKIHVFQYKGLSFHGRHGYTDGRAHPVGGCGFPRQSGLFARAWAFLYSKTKDPKYLQWAKDQVELLWHERDPKTGFVGGQIYPRPGTVVSGRKTAPARANWSVIWAALGFLDAVEWLDNPADKKLFSERGKALALINLNAFYKWDGKRFTDARPGWLGWTIMPSYPWLLMKYWERAGKPQVALDHLQRIADGLMKTWKPTRKTDAGQFGYMILLFAQLANETGQQRYMNFARRVGDYAAANLVARNGLVLGSGYYRIYDEQYHVPKLIHAFLALDHPKHAAIAPLIGEVMW